MEHRWCKRWEIEIDVQLTGQPGTECAVSTRNISMDGMFVDVPPQWLGDAKLVHVQLPAAAGMRRLKAFVVHDGGQGIGLMFCATENEDRHLLARYLGDIFGQQGE